MSMNINLIATLPVLAIDNKGNEIKSELHEKFECWQTPTATTKTILKSEDTCKAYIDWVLKHGRTEEVDIFAEDDFFCETSIGKKIYNWGEEHVERLDDFLEKYKDWNLKWYMS